MVIRTIRHSNYSAPGLFGTKVDYVAPGLFGPWTIRHPDDFASGPLGWPKTRPGRGLTQPGRKPKLWPRLTFVGRTSNRPKVRPGFGPPVKFHINQNNVYNVVSAQQFMTQVIIEHILIVDNDKS